MEIIILTSSQVTTLTSSQVTTLTSSQVTTLTSSQVTTLTSSQVTTLTSSQVTTLIEQSHYSFYTQQTDLITFLCYVRVRNKLSQINSLATVGCSLKYPNAITSPWNWRRDCCLCRTMRFYYGRDAQFIFKISCSTQKTKWNLLLSQTLSRVVVGEKDLQW